MKPDMRSDENIVSGRRALFFDVDGTLMAYGGYVPESAKRAIRKAREHGDLVFINSGRIYKLAKYIERFVENDGLLCGCGTDLYYGKDNFYSHEVPAEVLKGIEEECRKDRADLVLEGRDGVAVAPWARLKETFDVSGFIKEQDAIWPLDFYDPGYRANKFCIQYDEETDIPSFTSFAREWFDIIDRGHGFLECVPCGHGKAFFFFFVMELCGIEKENVYVFGDSTNDLDMIRFAGHSVIMGKHDRELEPYAEFITRDLEDDGIEYAMKHYGII